MYTNNDRESAGCERVFVLPKLYDWDPVRCFDFVNLEPKAVSL